jgi:predicted phage tail protein
MIQLHLHGILGHKYGKLHKFAVKSPKDIINAMEANFPEFRKDLKDLALKNIHYTFVCDNKWLKGNSLSENKIKNAKIDMMPSVLGSGVVLGTVAGVKITLLAVASFVVAIGSAVFAYIQSGKVEFPKIPGATGTSTALNRSLAFSNRENIVEQGGPVPLVYGRLKVGSLVIQSSVKTFPLSLTLTDEFVNSSSKKSNNQTAVIDGSNSELTSVTQISTLDPSK